MCEKVSSHENDLDLTSDVLPATYYLAPEQHKSRQDEMLLAADIFALGVIFNDVLNYAQESGTTGMLMSRKAHFQW